LVTWRLLACIKAFEARVDKGYSVKVSDTLSTYVALLREGAGHEKNGKEKGLARRDLGVGTFHLFLLQTEGLVMMGGILNK
jgi:hypothetical protein